jgi:murein DD-endopeptidase MepM/ murein hydrolase activator NlpD
MQREMKNIAAFAMVTLLISCSSQKEAVIVDHKDKFFSREGANKQVVVLQGETMDSIAKKYNVSHQDIMRLNKLASAQDLKPGASLLLPAYAKASNVLITENKTSGYRPVYNEQSGNKESSMGYFYSKKTTVTEKTYEDSAEIDNRQPASSWSKDPAIVENKLTEIESKNTTQAINSQQADLSPAEKKRSAEIEAEETPKSATSSPAKDFKTTSPLNLQNFEWPLQGKILSRFGNNGRKFNDGINIAAPIGTPIAAAADGKVAYIGNNVEGYGNLIILKHENNIMTAYAHLDEINVERGTQVKRGDNIGTVGKSGNVSQGQMHFSVRKGKKTIDPESSNG